MDKGSKRSGRSRKKRKESVEECKEGATDDSARSKRPRRKSRGKESEEDEEKKNPRDRERRARAKKVPSKRYALVCSAHTLCWRMGGVACQSLGVNATAHVCGPVHVCCRGVTCVHPIILCGAEW